MDSLSGSGKKLSGLIYSFLYEMGYWLKNSKILEKNDPCSQISKSGFITLQGPLTSIDEMSVDEKFACTYSILC